MQKIDGLDVRDRSLPPIGYHQAHRVHCFTCRFSFLVFLILRQEIWGVQAQKGLDILCEVLMKPLNAASFAAPHTLPAACSSHKHMIGSASIFQSISLMLQAPCQITSLHVSRSSSLGMVHIHVAPTSKYRLTHQLLVIRFWWKRARSIMLSPNHQSG